jgi:hypothetical protein
MHQAIDIIVWPTSLEIQAISLKQVFADTLLGMGSTDCRMYKDSNNRHEMLLFFNRHILVVFRFEMNLFSHQLKLFTVLKMDLKRSVGER